MGELKFKKIKEMYGSPFEQRMDTMEQKNYEMRKQVKNLSKKPKIKKRLGRQIKKEEYSGFYGRILGR